MTAPDTDHAAKVQDILGVLEPVDIADLGRPGIWSISDLATVEIERHVDALQAERDEARDELATERARVETISKEVGYWKSAVEDPAIYWGNDDPPYTLEEGEVTT